MPIPANWTIEEILALTYHKGINSELKRKIIEQYTSFPHFLDSKLPPALEAKVKSNDLFNAGVKSLVSEANWQLDLCEKNKSRAITLWDEDYPELLKRIPYAPVVIYVKGELLNSAIVSISIVGTRRCTTYGRINAERFAEHFARNNVLVCSGLAYGIDTISHLAAIKANGITYAVIASGIDCISPYESQKNAERIVDTGGAIISEYRFEVKALPAYFPQRNRIISGISVATLVIESALKGGALITAKFAFDQEREVYAVPGNITSPKSEGTNNLIKRDIATPALSPEQMIDELGLSQQMPAGKNETIRMNFDTATEKKIYEQISYEPLQVDTIAERTGIEISELLVILLNMEFNNYVKQLPGKHYIKA